MELPQARREAQQPLHALELVEPVLRHLRQERIAGRHDAEWCRGARDDLSGRAKPALQAFRLPFAQVSRTGLRTVVWGQLRGGPGRQPYRLEQYRGGRWVTVGGALLTSAAGFFKRTVRAAPGSELRVFASRQQLTSLPLRVA